MRFVIDACAIINLFNAGYLELACHLPRCEILVTPIVLGECSTDCAAEILRLHAAGHISFVDDDLIPVERFLELVGDNDIGDGEVEAIAVCELHGFGFCSDDGKARTLATGLIGKENVVGSLRLLRWLVEDGEKQCTEAFDAYLVMLRQGGFLPPLNSDFFCIEEPC